MARARSSAFEPTRTGPRIAAALLALVFNYDAAANLREAENQSLLAREGAREVIRELASRVFEGGDVDSDRFKEIIGAMKAALPYRGRALFHPIRLALAEPRR